MTDPAPIVQLLLTLQFRPGASSLSIVDWAALRAEFDELPIFTQIPRGGAMPIRLGEVAPETPFGFPRLHMASSDLSQIMMIQDDRVSVGWTRTTSLQNDPSYPGFNATFERFKTTIDKVLSFFEETAVEQVRPFAAELLYLDAFVMAKSGKIYRRLGDVFTCVQSQDNFAFNQFSLSFQKPLGKERGDSLEGMVESVITGLVQTPDDEIASQFQTTVRFSVEGLAFGAIDDPFRAAHEVAQKNFSVLVKPGASTILEEL